MTEPLRFGVLGCADIAWRRMLPALTACRHTEVLAVASRDGAKAARFAARFGGDALEGYDRLLARDDVDAVYVPLPPGLRGKWVTAALAAGKHVLAEKPLAPTAAEAARLVALARREALVLQENYMFLHHPVHAEVRRLVAEGVIGAVRGLTVEFGIPPRAADDIRYSRALGGGALADLGGYPVRLAALLLGSELDVAGASLRVDPARGVDLSGSVLLVGADGTPARLAFGLEMSYRCSYELWGSGGRLTVDRAFTPPPDHAPRIVLDRDGCTEERFVPASDQFAGVARGFVRAVREGVASPLHGTPIVAQALLVDRIRTTAVVTKVVASGNQSSYS